jgi:hypothetical protein
MKLAQLLLACAKLLRHRSATGFQLGPVEFLCQLYQSMIVCNGDDWLDRSLEQFALTASSPSTCAHSLSLPPVGTRGHRNHFARPCRSS